MQADSCGRKRGGGGGGRQVQVQARRRLAACPQSGPGYVAASQPRQTAQADLTSKAEL